ncbi:MAG: hypothetical protein GXO86_05925 [Chlorobi bacterium]|nr:hypothetical protein [Chlorobiota bacterium]
MTTVELKNILIHKIASIDDETFLKAIRTIIDAKTESTIYKTSHKQKQSIKEGLDQLQNGEFYTNEQLEAEVNKWLEEK